MFATYNGQILFYLLNKTLKQRNQMKDKLQNELLSSSKPSIARGFSRRRINSSLVSKNRQVQQKSIIFQKITQKNTFSNELSVEFMPHKKYQITNSYKDKKSKEDQIYIFQNDEIKNEAQIVKKDQRSKQQNCYRSQPFNCVGKLVSYFPKAQRVSRTSKQFSNTKIMLQGTAFLIGKNILLTSAHNIYLREFSQTAQKVVFYPEVAQNEKQFQRICVKATNFQIPQEYKAHQHEYFSKFDLAVVALEQNQFIKNQMVLKIKWGYCRWMHENKDVTLIGYPGTGRGELYKDSFDLMAQTSPTKNQQQFILYHHTTSSGQSGAPLIVIEDQNHGQYGDFKVIGLHKGSIPNYNMGITFNTLQNPKETILKMIQLLGMQDHMKSYEPSYDRLKKQYSGVKEQQNQISLLSQKINAAKVQIGEKQRIILDQNKSIISKDQQINRLKSYEQENRIKLENMIRSKNQKINQINKSNIQFEKQNQTLAKQNQELLRQLSSKTDNPTNPTGLASFQQSIEAYQQENKSLNAQIGRLKLNQLSKDLLIGQLEDKLSTAQSLFDQLQRTHQELLEDLHSNKKQQLYKSKQQLHKGKQQLDRLNQENKSLNEVNNTLKLKLIHLQIGKFEKEQQIKNLNDQVNKMSEQIQQISLDLVQSLNYQRQKNTQLNASLKQLKELNKAKQAENQQHQIQNCKIMTHLKGQTQKYQQSSQSLQEEINSLKLIHEEQIQKKDSLIGVSQAKVKTIEGQLAAITNELLIQQEKQFQLKNAIDDLKHRLRVSQNRQQRHQSELEQQRMSRDIQRHYFQRMRDYQQSENKKKSLKNQLQLLQQINKSGIFGYSSICQKNISLINSQKQTHMRQLEELSARNKNSWVFFISTPNFPFLFHIFQNDTNAIERRYNFNRDLAYHGFRRDIKYLKQTENINLSQQGVYLIYSLEQLEACGFNIHLKRIFSYDWTHLQYMSFNGCHIDDKAWRLCVENSYLFPNLKILTLFYNNITQIRQGDLEKFKSLRYLGLFSNPLTQQSKELLDQYQYQQITIFYELFASLKKSSSALSFVQSRKTKKQA